MIDAWLIKHSTAGGSSYLDEAYTNEQSCNLVCEDLRRGKEFEDFKSEPVKGEPIPVDRIIVNKSVYSIRIVSPDDIYYQRAIKKLTPEELNAITRIIRVQSI